MRNIALVRSFSKTCILSAFAVGNLDDDFFGDGQSTVSPFAGVKESEHLSTTQNEEDDEEPNPLVAKDETIDDEFPSPIGSLDSKPAMKRTNSSTQQKSSVTKAPGKTTSSGDTPTDTPSTSNKLTESPVSHIKPAESSNRAAEAPAAKKAPVKQKSPEIAKPAKPSEPIPKHKPAVTHYDDEDDEEAVNPAIMQDEDFGDYEALPKKKAICIQILPLPTDTICRYHQKDDQKSLNQNYLKKKKKKKKRLSPHLFQKQVTTTWIVFLMNKMCITCNFAILLSAPYTSLQ